MIDNLKYCRLDESKAYTECRKNGMVIREQDGLRFIYSYAGKIMTSILSGKGMNEVKDNEYLFLMSVRKI
jgi:hypothetical protein